MPKGFVRRPFRFLAGVLLGLGLPGAVSFSGPSPRPSWWEIRLTATVTGSYALTGGGAPVSGEYTCQALWEGRLEVDGEDFLLYHLKTETLEWRLAEKAGRGAGESILEGADAALKPELRMNYVLSNGPNVEIDFDLLGIAVPLHPFPVKVTLEFPRSEAWRPLFPGSSYADFVTRGSNRVVVPRSDFRRSKAERTFSWEWRRVKQVAAGSVACLLAERHKAEAVVSVVAH